MLQVSFMNLLIGFRIFAAHYFSSNLKTMLQTDETL